MQYVSCHDNYTLWDRLVSVTGSYAFRGADPVALRYNRLASAMVLLSTGIAFFQGGEEFCRTKEGNGNSYNGPADLNAIRWNDAVKHRDLVAWYRGLITLRHELYPDTGRGTANGLCFLDAQCGTVAFTAPCREGSRWKELLVAANPFDKTYPLTLPGGSWQLLCNGESSEVWMRRTAAAEGTIDLPATAVVVYGRA